VVEKVCCCIRHAFGSAVMKKGYFCRKFLFQDAFGGSGIVPMDTFIMSFPQGVASMPEVFDSGDGPRLAVLTVSTFTEECQVCVLGRAPVFRNETVE
jgi:hypothetical protein